MKVLLINKDLSLGGGTTIINNLERNLSKFGTYIDVAIFENNIELTSINKSRIIVLSKQKRIAKTLRPLYFLVFFIKLLFIVPKYDLIFTFERYPSYFNVILTRIFSKKSIIYVINPLLTSLKNIYKNGVLLKFHVWLHKVVFSLTDLVVVFEKSAKKEFINYWSVKEKKIIIIPPFVDFKKIKILSKNKLNQKKVNIFLKNKIIVNVGRLHSQKNQVSLIRAFYLVRKKFKKTILLIIGTGKEKNTLEKLIKKLSLKDCTFIIENEPNPFKYLLHSDVFVLSSGFEGFGIVLLEALYFGLPIVSTDCSYGLRHIIAPQLSTKYQISDKYINDYGTIVLNKNQQAIKLMANSINYYLNRKTNNNIKTKRKRRALKFSKEKILPIWVRAIDSLFV